MSEACECCGVSYDRFRTGYAYGDVFQMLWVDDPDSSNWRNKRRNTVLGYWRALKQEMWASHLKLCLMEFESAQEQEIEEMEAISEPMYDYGSGDAPSDYIPW